MHPREMKEKTPTSPSLYHEEKNMTKAELKELNEMIDMILHWSLFAAAIMLIIGSIWLTLALRALG